MGVGMVVVAADGAPAAAIEAHLDERNESHWRIGRIVEGSGETILVHR
jgi:phosphoribosylaminoimidazole (AIR) synthetase